MRPDEWKRRRARHKALKAKAKNTLTEQERFRASLPNVDPVKVTEAATYYFDESKGWWLDSACPMHPETKGPFSSLGDAMEVGEMGCTPCREEGCPARITSGPETEAEISRSEVITHEGSDPRPPGRAMVVDLKLRTKPTPRRGGRDRKGMVAS
jgi:hypothetical protein